MVQVTAAIREGAEIEFEYEFGDNLEAAVQRFGADIVWAYTLKGLTVAAQGHARGMIKSGKSADEIRSEMRTWKPGAPRATKSANDKIRELLDKMSPEERAKLASELKGGKAKAA